MPDPKRLLLECKNKAMKLEHVHDTTSFWMAEMKTGHPRAQDFEPTGHGGSDPTGQNGIRPDRATHDEKTYNAAIMRAWKALDEALLIAGAYQNGVKPVRKDGDVGDIWCPLHAQFDVWEPIHKLGMCRPCYERRLKLREMGLELTVEEVRFHAHSRNGRWRVHRQDPTQPPSRLAALARLQLGTETLSAEQAAERLG
jgi:hypothetical protein